MFRQHARWSGAVLSFKRDLILFENPYAEVALPTEFTELATRMFRFDYGRSWSEWPQGRVSLKSRVSEALDHVNSLAAVARYTW